MSELQANDPNVNLETLWENNNIPKKSQERFDKTMDEMKSSENWETTKTELASRLDEKLNPDKQDKYEQLKKDYKKFKDDAKPLWEWLMRWANKKS